MGPESKQCALDIRNVEMLIQHPFQPGIQVTFAELLGLAHAFRTKGLVEKALAHVAGIHPVVTQVTYDDELRWCFTDSADVSVVFNGTEDIGLLEDAADEAYQRGLQNVVIKLQTSKHYKGE